MSAQQDADIDVGASVMSFPFVDMVCLGPGWWSVAPRDEAPAVAGGHRDPLRRGEQPLRAPELHRAPVSWNTIGSASDRADQTLGGTARYRRRLTLDRRRIRDRVRGLRATRARARPGCGMPNTALRRRRRRDGTSRRTRRAPAARSCADRRRARSALCRSSGSTKRAPPRRGAVTRSIASVTNAAFSGSSSATSRVMPSAMRVSAKGPLVAQGGFAIEDTLERRVRREPRERVAPPARAEGRSIPRAAAAPRRPGRSRRPRRSVRRARGGSRPSRRPRPLRAASAAATGLIQAPGRRATRRPRSSPAIRAPTGPSPTRPGAPACANRSAEPAPRTRDRGATAGRSRWRPQRAAASTCRRAPAMRTCTASNSSSPSGARSRTSGTATKVTANVVANVVAGGRAWIDSRRVRTRYATHERQSVNNIRT